MQKISAWHEIREIRSSSALGNEYWPVEGPVVKSGINQINTAAYVGRKLMATYRLGLLP